MTITQGSLSMVPTGGKGSTHKGKDPTPTSWRLLMADEIPMLALDTAVLAQGTPMRLLCLFCAVWLSACVTVGQDAEKKPKAPEFQGEFAQLVRQPTEQAVNGLLSGNNQTLEAVLTDPNVYTPPVLFALAHQLYQQGEITPALFWFYTAQLRARSDANKSLDPTTQQGVTELSNQFAKDINRYALGHLDELTITVNHVLTWDRQTKRYYDPRWVALHGQEAYTKTTIGFKPQSEWPVIDELTRQGFEKGFQQLLQKIRG